MKLSSEELGKRYATALYDFASERNLVSDIKSELATLQEVLQSNQSFLATYSNPALNLDQKRSFIRALENHFSQEMQNFLQLLFDYQRMQSLPDVIEAYNKIYDARHRIAHGEVISATKMSAEQLTQLAAAYAKMNDLERFELENSVDESLLGGVILKTDGKVIDGSIRTKIATLRSNLVNNI